MTTFKPGDDVFGQGAATYAAHTAVPVATLAKKPDTMTFEEAATLGLTGVTAWKAIDAAGLQPGQRVLIHGGAGGVGSVAVQLAHRKHAHVIATTSTPNVEHVRGLGADEVIDYTTTPFESAVSAVDVVLDTVGGDVLSRSWKVLTPPVAETFPLEEVARAHASSETGHGRGRRVLRVS